MVRAAQAKQRLIIFFDYDTNEWLLIVVNLIELQTCLGFRREQVLILV